MNRKTYTCDKCAKVFKQKSHFDDHQNRKNDCSTSTKLSKIVEEKVEKILKDKEESFPIKVHVTTSKGETYDINVNSDQGVNGLYTELCDILPLSYIQHFNYNIPVEDRQKWFNFRRILSEEDIANGHRAYDFYRMRDGEHLFLSIERPQYEHIVHIRPFYMGGLFGGLFSEYKTIDKPFITHYGYYYRLSSSSLKDEEKEIPIIVVFQKTNLYPTVAYPPNLVLGKNVDYEKNHHPVHQFFAYACENPKNTGKGCFNPLSHHFDQSLQWKDTVEDALKTVCFYDETFYTRNAKNAKNNKYIEKKIELTEEAIRSMTRLYNDHKITGKFVNNI